MAGYTSGGEQQMCAIGRALMSRPKMILLDEPSMGLAPQIVEEIFEIVQDLNEKEGVSFLLAEQNTNMALHYARYGYILENGRVVLDGEAKALRENEDVKEFYLGIAEGKRKIVPRRRSTTSGASAGWRERSRSELSAMTQSAVLRRARDPRSRGARARSVRAPARVTSRRDAARAGLGQRILPGVDPRDRSISREALATPAGAAQVRPARRCRRQDPPFGGFHVTRPARLRRLFMSPGPIFEPEGHGEDLWRRGARAVRGRLPRRATSCSTASPITSRPAASSWSAGAQALGCAVIPGGVGNTEQQLEVIAHLQADAAMSARPTS